MNGCKRFTVIAILVIPIVIASFVRAQMPPEMPPMAVRLPPAGLALTDQTPGGMGPGSSMVGNAGSLNKRVADLEKAMDQQRLWIATLAKQLKQLQKDAGPPKSHPSVEK